MPKVTLSIPKKELEDFKKVFPEVNVAEVARRAIKDKIEELETIEKLKQEGKL